MADTRAQLEVEDWVRQRWMLETLGMDFYRERVRLSSGGVFDFDAVSSDRRVVATISTSAAVTARGRAGAGKMHKIRSDMFFLLLAEADRRIVVLTERDMYQAWTKEQKDGRVPASIEFVHAELPQHLADRLGEARRKASDEVSPP